MLNKIKFWQKKPSKTEQNFNLIISGFGGQGVITLADLVSKIALSQNYKVKQSELHGLAQRGGSVQTHVRFGNQIWSPKVKRASADLVIALDLLEAARGCLWADPAKTKILANSEFFWPYEEKIDSEKISDDIKKFAKELKLVDATQKVKKLTGKTISTNIFMLAAAIKNGFLPFKKETAWNVISENLKPEFLDENKKVYQAAFSK